MAADDEVYVSSADAKLLFIAMLATKERRISADEQKRMFAATQQTETWQELLSTVEAGFGDELERPLKSALDALREGIERYATYSISAELTGAIATADLKTKAFVVKGPLPLIDYPSFRQLRNFILEEPWFCLAVIIRAVAGVINVRDVTRKIGADDPTGLLADPRLIDASIEASLLVQTHTLGLDKTVGELALAKGEYKKLNDGARELASRQQKLVAELEVKGREFIDEHTAQVAALRMQLIDSLRLEASRDLWLKRSSAHLWWMIGAFALMLAGVALVVTCVLFYALPALEPTPFEILTKSGYATQKLVLISLCVVGAAWLLRFVARAIVENMSLRADAQHRQSMLETYLALRGEVGLKDEERAIILNALFRPLPGQPADENPPTPVGEALQKLIAR